jgi:hypothetical protein
MKSVAAGMNPMDLKRGIDLAVTRVVEDLKSRSKPVSGSNEIAQVGIISANGDTVVGEKIAEAMDKVGKEGVITVEEAKGLEFELDVVEGMQFDRGYLSPYFITNPEKMQVELATPTSSSTRRSSPTSRRCFRSWKRSCSRAVRSSSSPRTSRARLSPRSSSTSCAAASRSRPSRLRASAIAARRCSRTSRS